MIELETVAGSPDPSPDRTLRGPGFLLKRNASDVTRCEGHRRPLECCLPAALVGLPAGRTGDFFHGCLDALGLVD